MAEWKLFIDDIRSPECVGCREPVVVARSSTDAILFIDLWGIPSHIYFDHDLGGDDTSMRVLKHLENIILDEKRLLPHKFDYTVHSANPVGFHNIIGYMNNLIWLSKEIENEDRTNSRYR